MPAGAGAIRAGRAFVEIFAEDSKLRRGLANAQRRVAAFGASVRGIGTKLLGLGVGIVAPLILAARQFADTGDEIQKLSVRTGIGAEALSQLGFAAEQSGSDLDTLGKLILRMNRRIGRITAGQAATSQVEALEALGLSARELETMGIEDRLLSIADAMAGMEDQAEAAGLAQRLMGTQVDALLPLLLEGREGIEALKDEADALGRTITTEQADDAAALADAMNRVSSQLSAAFVQIGAAVAPVLTEFLNRLTGVGKVLIRLVQENTGFIRSMLKVGAIVAAAGLSIVALGGAIQLVAFAIGGLSVLIGVLGSIITLPFTLLAGAVAAVKGLLLGLLITVGGFPAMLAILGTVAATVLALWVTTGNGVNQIGAGISNVFGKVGAVGGAVVGFLRDKFGFLLSIAKQTFQGIRDALAAGDIQAAAMVLWQGLKLAWLEGTQSLAKRWIEFKAIFVGTFQEATSQIAANMVELVAAIKTIWTELSSSVQSIWGKAVGAIAEQLLRLQGLADETFDVEGAIEASRDITETRQQEIEGEREGRLGEIEQERRGQRGALDEMRAEDERRLQEKFADELEANRKGLEDARAEFNAAVKKSAAAQEKAAQENEGLSIEDRIAQLFDEMQAGASQFRESAERRAGGGTFGMLGGRSFAGEIASSPMEEAAKQTAENTKRTAENTEAVSDALSFV